MKPTGQQTIPSEIDINNTKTDNIEEEEDNQSKGKFSDLSPKIKGVMAKKTSKIIVVFLGVMFVLYKMFAGSKTEEKAAQPPQTNQVQSQKVNYAESNILSKENQKKGSIVTRKEDESINPIKKYDQEKVFNDQKADKKIDLLEPELPPLPDISGGSLDTSKKENTQKVEQSIDLNKVSDNGIPIVNSSDLTLEQKRKISMFVVNEQTNNNQQAARPNSDQKKKQKSDFIFPDGSLLSIKKMSENVNAQKIQSLETTLVQGKMLDAVLETSIHSQFPGKVRAVVSSDIYGEMGEKVLIAKGSRLYGEYTSTVSKGQSRIMIMWNRVIRPDGVSVSIDAQASDQWGRTGIEGDVDNRFGDALTNSLLLTFATLGASVALEKIGGTNTAQTQVINPSGTFTTSNINPVNVAAQSAIQTANDYAKKMLGDAGSIQPIITLPQGTKIKVMVNTDITMPPFKKVIVP